ncbi:gliding motility lipoprotein GldH [Marivirga sp.]|uniref:gliding motility lipoprotein GldH n=1 Tax=Marivirga sp. TaxID=2018662 RepID=UPI002D7FED3A|nr:gliding motility lipoprotein GldH [Marivirga sp.]HET8861485.1 gliding motility lipoprotein GldH [Marivirga sp.]
MRPILSIICLTFLIFSCTEDRYFEDNIDFKDRIWGLEESAEFDIEIDSIEVPYRIKLNVRNTLDYPYRNLYIQYSLSDSNRNISKKLHNIKLFEGKTGKPFGDRQSEVFSHQLILQDSVYFPEKGNYTIKLKQYMREKELKGMVSVGIRLEQIK